MYNIQYHKIIREVCNVLMSRKAIRSVKNSLNKEKRNNAYYPNNVGKFTSKKQGKKKKPR